MRIEVQKFKGGELVSSGSYAEGTETYDTLCAYLKDVQDEIAHGRLEGLLSCFMNVVQTTFHDRGFTWKLIQVYGGDEA